MVMGAVGMGCGWGQQRIERARRFAGQHGQAVECGGSPGHQAGNSAAGAFQVVAGLLEGQFIAQANSIASLDKLIGFLLRGQVGLGHGPGVTDRSAYQCS